MDEHKQKASSVYKDYHEQNGKVPKDLLRHFSILKKCKNKFDCLVNEMLFISPKTHSERAKRFNLRKSIYIISLHCMLILM